MQSTKIRSGKYTMSLKIITELSQKYGSDKKYVLAGGGNTSFKDENFLYVKPSDLSEKMQSSVSLLQLLFPDMMEGHR